MTISNLLSFLPPKDILSDTLSDTLNDILVQLIVDILVVICVEGKNNLENYGAHNLSANYLGDDLRNLSLGLDYCGNYLGLGGNYNYFSLSLGLNGWCRS